MEQILHTVLEAGLEKPVRILQVTDVHLVEYSDQDPVDQQELLKRRRETFRKEGGYPPHTQNEYLEEAFRIAEEQDALLVITGDAMDLNSDGNHREFRRITAGKDFMFTPGGHEFQRICKRVLDEPADYYPGARARVAAAFPELKLTFDSRVVGGVNVITMDNSVDYFRAEILDALKKEVQKGLPMVLFMHDPLHDKALLHIAGIPLQRPTDEEYRISDQVIELIGTCPLVLATFAGHYHSEQETIAPCGAKVYVTPGLFKGIARMIEIR